MHVAAERSVWKSLGEPYTQQWTSSGWYDDDDDDNVLLLVVQLVVSRATKVLNNFGQSIIQVLGERNSFKG